MGVSATVAGFCADPAVTTADLRSYLGTRPAAFTTDGSELFVLVSGFEHGGLLDPDQGASTVYFGVASQAPAWDRQRNVVTGAIRQVTAREDVPVGVVLPAGRYWIWISNFPVVKLIGCTSGALSDVVVAG